MKSIGIDASSMVAFMPLSNALQQKRTAVHSNLKEFCKIYGFPQYRIKDIEESAINNIDLKIFKKYIDAIDGATLLKEWVSLFPNVAKKYKINSIL